MVYLESFPEPRPQTVFARGSHTTVGSSGAGKALNFASLGCDATLWGLLGDDEAGQLVRSYLADRSVGLIPVTDPKGTMRHVNLMDDKGGRISIFAHSGSHEFSVDVESVRPIARAVDVVTLTIMNYCRQFLPMLREIGKPVWVDLHDYDGNEPVPRGVHRSRRLPVHEFAVASRLAELPRRENRRRSHRGRRYPWCGWSQRHHGDRWMGGCSRGSSRAHRRHKRCRRWFLRRIRHHMVTGSGSRICPPGRSSTCCTSGGVARPSSSARLTAPVHTPRRCRSRPCSHPSRGRRGSRCAPAGLRTPCQQPRM